MGERRGVSVGHGKCCAFRIRKTCRSAMTVHPLLSWMSLRAVVRHGRRGKDPYDLKVIWRHAMMR